MTARTQGNPPFIRQRLNRVTINHVAIGIKEIDLNRSTTPTDIVQATLEGVASRIALIAEQLPSLPETIYVGVGAASSSPLWVQMICNALNRPVHLVQAAEATAQGVALMLASVVDGTALEAYTPAIALFFTPDPDNAARERQQDLYRRLYSSGF